MRRHLTQYSPWHRPVAMLVAVATLAYQVEASAAAPASVTSRRFWRGERVSKTTRPFPRTSSTFGSRRSRPERVC